MEKESFKKSRRVREITTTLTYADTTSAKAFALPAGARIIQWVINVKTAFSGGTTEIDTGTSSDPDYLVDGASLAAQGNAVLATALKQPGYETTAVTDVYMNVGAGNAAGEVDVTVLYSLQVDRRL